MLSRGKKVNVIAAMFSTGIVALDLITADTVNGDKFFEFLRASLIPHHRYKTLNRIGNKSRERISCALNEVDHPRLC